MSPYNLLNSAERQIRLLEILPTTEDTAPIHCRLHVVSLNDSPEYIALSYIWGDLNQEREHVFVDNHEIPIMPNLFSLLKRLRRDRFEGALGQRYKNISMGMVALFAQMAQYRRDNGSDEEPVAETVKKLAFQTYDDKPVIWYWADAICIDQNNMCEREDQVRLMNSIYPRARLTISWLGTENLGNLEAAVELLSLFDDDRSEIAEPRDSVPGGWLANYPILLQPDETSPLYNGYWTSLFQLDQLTYWKRMWIVQELALSKVLLVMAEDKILSLPSLSRFCEFCENARYGRITRPSCVPPRLWSILQRHFNHIQMTWTIRSTKPSDDDNDLSFKYLFILATVNHQCSDPRDHIFALQGMLNNLYPADYRKSTREVYCEYARDWVNRTAELDLLIYHGLTPNHENQFKLPSWVPDWQKLSTSGYCTPLRINRSNNVGFINLCTLEPWVTPDFKLECSGIRVAEVEHVYGGGQGCVDIVQLYEEHRSRTSKESTVLLQQILRAATCDGIVSLNEISIKFVDGELDSEGSAFLYLFLLMTLLAKGGDQNDDTVTPALLVLGLSNGDGCCTDQFFHTFAGLQKDINWVAPHVWIPFFRDNFHKERIQELLSRDDLVVSTTGGLLGWVRAGGIQRGDHICAIRARDSISIVALREKESGYMYCGQCGILEMDNASLTKLIQGSQNQVQRFVID